jgi:hypothetical protein
MNGYEILTPGQRELIDGLLEEEEEEEEDESVTWLTEEELKDIQEKLNRVCKITRSTEIRSLIEKIEDILNLDV